MTITLSATALADLTYAATQARRAPEELAAQAVEQAFASYRQARESADAVQITAAFKAAKPTDTKATIEAAVNAAKPVAEK
jgi:DNA-binding protein H-NS